MSFESNDVVAGAGEEKSPTVPKAGLSRKVIVTVVAAYVLLALMVLVVLALIVLTSHS